MDSQLLAYSMAVLAVSFVAGSISLIWQWSDDNLHLFLSFGAGVFLGAVFIHLLPEAMNHGPTTSVSMAVLTGFMLIFFVERILLSRSEEGSRADHRVISITAVIGLSLHSLIEGFGMAVASIESGLLSALFFSILIHKVPASFALGSLLKLARMSRRTILGYIFLFSAMTPLGALIMLPFFRDLNIETMGWLTGIVTGSFLYVAAVDLLPEVFHSPKRRWLHLFLLLVGILAMARTRGHLY